MAIRRLDQHRDHPLQHVTRTRPKHQHGGLAGPVSVTEIAWLRHQAERRSMESCTELSIKMGTLLLNINIGSSSLPSICCWGAGLWAWAKNRPLSKAPRAPASEMAVAWLDTRNRVCLGGILHEAAFLLRRIQWPPSSCSVATQQISE